MITIEIERREWLPCALKVFKINGKDASEDDFGETNIGGSARDGTCHASFIHGYPTTEVLEKYGITLEEFKEVCEALEDKLYVGACGCCW